MNAPMAMRIVAGTRLWIRPRTSARTAPGSDADEVDHDRDRRDEQVEQELVAGLVRVQRVRQDPPLRHEDVRAEDAPRTSANAPVMFRNGVSRRSCRGKRVATGTPVAGSRA